MLSACLRTVLLIVQLDKTRPLGATCMLEVSLLSTLKGQESCAHEH